MNEIGDQVRRTRTSKGWSQAELSRRSGISQANISVLETGKSDPRASTIAALAAALELELLLLPKRELPWIRRALTGTSNTLSKSVLDEVFVPDPAEDEEDR